MSRDKTHQICTRWTEWGRIILTWRSFWSIAVGVMDGLTLGNVSYYFVIDMTPEDRKYHWHRFMIDHRPVLMKANCCI